MERHREATMSCDNGAPRLQPASARRTGWVVAVLVFGALGIATAQHAGGADAFVAATPISGASGVAEGSNAGAGKEPGEPDHAGNAGGASVWWRWTAPATGEVTFDTFGSGFDTLLAVYTGSSVSGLTPTDFNDDAAGGRQSRVRFTARQGQAYFIAVDGYNGATGAVALNWQAASGPQPPPAGGADAFVSAIPISGASGVAEGSNAGAGKEPGEPDHAGNAGGASVWWRWTAPATGEVTFDTFGSSFDTLLAVYTGSSVGGLTPTGSDDDAAGGRQSQVRFTARRGQAYSIAVDGYNGARGAVVLNWLSEETGIPGGGGTISGTLRVAEGYVLDGDTLDPRDPVVENNSPPGQEVPLPITIAGHAGFPDDDLDIYRIAAPGPIGIALTIADPEESDLDLYFAHTDGTIIAESIGVGRYEAIETDPGLTGEFLVAARAFEGSSNYILSIGTTRATSGGGRPAGSIRVGDLQPDAEFVANEIVVKFTEELDSGQAEAFTSFITGGMGLAQKTNSPSGPILMELYDTVSARSNSETGDGGMAPLRHATAEEAAKARTLRAIKMLRRNPAVLYADPNYISHAMAVPDDPHSSKQWHYEQINLPEAWDITKGHDDVVMAVVDTGIFPHSDLSNRLLRDSFGRLAGYDFISDPSSARDGDGIDPDPTDAGDFDLGFQSSFHGTHVAGTIGAETDNGIGVAGVTWRGKIMPLRVLGAGGRGTHFDILQAVLYAAGLPNDSGTVPFQRADVVNLSLGRDCGDPLAASEADTFRAAQDAGVVIVAAAGNDNCGFPTPMSTAEGVISVSAVGVGKNKTPYSNYGPKIDVAAPGGNMGADVDGDGFTDGVLSTLADDSRRPAAETYAFMEGTSMAAPHVAGVVGLMFSVNPDLTPEDVNRLLDGTHPHPNAAPITQDLGATGRDDIYGHGLIDARRAVQVARAIRSGRPAPAPPPDPVLSVFPGSLNFGASRTELPLAIQNVGGGTLRVDDITTDAPWLTVDDPLFPNLTVRVDRAALPEGGSFGRVAITSNGGDETVLVAVQKQSNFAGGDIGTVYVLAMDPDTLETVEQDLTTAAEDYAYQMPALPAGAYIVAAGTDRDDDGYVCDTGEACGIFPLQDSPRVVDVDGDETRVDFPVSLSLLATVQSSRDASGNVLPSEGFRRLTTTTRGFRRLP